MPLASTFRRFAVLLCLFVWLGCGLSAATRILPVSLTSDRTIGRVNLPTGAVMLTLQSRAPRGEWVDVDTRAAQPGLMSITLPATDRKTKFRVNVTIEAPSRAKFPAAFYRGKKSFLPSQAVSTTNLSRMTAYASSVAAPAMDTLGTAGEEPVRPDIWKVSGTTAYFFNQLRGLQVIDLSTPADPGLVASLRLPAAGQDLYLLPSAAGYQDVLLVSSDQSLDDNQTYTTLRVVRVEAGQARVLQSASLSGYPQGSRLLGRRLFLCTTDWSAGKTSLTEWLLSAENAPAKQSETALAGYFEELAAGSDWLAVAMTPAGVWDHSAVNVFHLGETGLGALTAAPVALQGRINDSYKMQWRGGVLTTITQQWASPGGLTTWLENFRADAADADGARLGQLELARGETLHATRFAGDKAYIVTFLQKDPLFVVDLTDPAAPVIAGHVEVPGWSTHIEPLGDKLFTVGFENGSVTASLFDVSDPAAPTELRRLALTEGYSYSEANWDPQALQLLPDAGLALVPLTTYGDTGANYGVRLVEVNADASDLTLRGLIPGRFEARRAALVGDVAVTLSQRNLSTALIADRDHPAILSDTLLAWPVDRALPAGDEVLSVEAGGSWADGLPTARVTPLALPDNVTAELPLEEGYVRDAALRDGRLYVLRESGASGPGRGWFWMASLGQLHLDVYDASDLHAPRLLGTCSWDAGSLGLSGTSRLLWPQPNRPSVLLENQGYYFYRPMPILVDRPVMIASNPVMADVAVTPPLVAAPVVAEPAIASLGRVSWMPWPGRGQPRLLTFDVTDPANPTVAEPLSFGPDDATLSDVKVADSGLVVIGLDQWRERLYRRNDSRSELLHGVQVIDVPASGTPGARKLIDLPGSLFDVTELSREGFLAYTRTSGKIQVSACDGWDAFGIAETSLAGGGVAVAGGRTIFCVASEGIRRIRLTDEGNLVADGVIATKWTPDQLRVVGDRLLGSTWRRLLDAPVSSSDGAVSDWTFAVGFSLENVTRSASGAWIVPMGDYGYEVAQP